MGSQNRIDYVIPSITSVTGYVLLASCSKNSARNPLDDLYSNLFSSETVLFNSMTF
ncbi:hypothetical protein GCM10007877_00620 [Marinibactrum halimedae]|uniref:Uncharacterized protein n=1 Tax=Marinibactrum halimedae TaxID=1444977 RepID=A0AA37WLZ9_9GAMM|nr:hypothetical protein GCM10007877_00620 [Marinibactrum halimedae]